MKYMHVSNMGAMMRQWTALFSYWCNFYGTGQELIDRMLEEGYSEAVDMCFDYHTGCASVTKLLWELCPEKDGIITKDTPKYVDENYWLAQYLVIYLWLYPRTLKEVFSVFSYDELVSLYDPWHEVGERRFARELEDMLRDEGLPPLEQIDRYKKD